MIHPSDEEPAKTLPNGWVMLEPGERIPDDRMYQHRYPDECWELADHPVHPIGLSYDPPLQRALARRVAVAEREW